jgi:hypothetical protein
MINDHVGLLRTLFDESIGKPPQRFLGNWTSDDLGRAMTRDEIPRVAVYRRTRWAENFLATMIIGLPTGLLIGSLLPFVAPMRGPWLALEVIAGQTSGILLGAILTTLFKGPVAGLTCTRASTPVARIEGALDEIGYSRVGMIGSNVIFRPMVRAGLASGWITMCERDEHVFLSGPYRHLVRLGARLEPSAVIALPR